MIDSNQLEEQESPETMSGVKSGEQSEDEVLKVSRAELDGLIKGLADDYSSYLKIDCFKDTQRLQETIDGHMSILEESCGVLEGIRNDSTVCFEVLLPQIMAENERLESLYEWIDRLELVVGTVKKSVDEMSLEVLKARQDLSKSINPVRRIFSSLLFNHNPKGGGGDHQNQSRRDSSSPVPSSYVEPQIFKTSDLFPMSKREKDQDT